MKGITNELQFAEKQFTTSRYEECTERLKLILQNNSIKANQYIILNAILIASLLGQKQTRQIFQITEEIENKVAAQVDSFKVSWTFSGTKHYISNNEQLALYRDWLLQLFTALEGDNRDAILSGLGKVKQTMPQ